MSSSLLGSSEKVLLPKASLFDGVISSLGRAWSAFEAARLKSAQRVVLGTLRSYDDTMLTQLGYQADDIALIRRGIFPHK